MDLAIALRIFVPLQLGVPVKCEKSNVAKAVAV